MKRWVGSASISTAQRRDARAMWRAPGKVNRAREVTPYGDPRTHCVTMEKKRDKENELNTNQCMIPCAGRDNPMLLLFV